jgi:hypothetical protein
MSAQINLYHSRFLKQRDLLSLGNVALAAAVLYAVLAAAGSWVWQEAATRKEAATVAEAQLKSAKEQLEAATKATVTRKPSPLLLAELDGAEGLLRRRGEIAGLLESGAIGSTGGFTDYLRGFARQAPEGLWLTGFTIGSGGNDMEIRGSMLNPSALPDYIRRLGTEKAFHGRNFSSLTMNRVVAVPVVRPVAQGAAVLPSPSVGPRPIDFVLMPRLGQAQEGKP